MHELSGTNDDAPIVEREDTLAEEVFEGLEPLPTGSSSIACTTPDGQVFGMGRPRTHFRHRLH